MYFYDLGTVIFVFIILIYSTLKTNYILEHTYEKRKYYVYLVLMILVAIFSSIVAKLSILPIIIAYTFFTIFIYKNKLVEKLIYLAIMYFIIFTINAFLISGTIVLCSFKGDIENFIFSYSHSIFVVAFIIIYLGVEINLFGFWKSGYFFCDFFEGRKSYRINLFIIIFMCLSISGIMLERNYILGGTLVGFTDIIIILLAAFMIMALYKINLDAKKYLTYKNNSSRQLKSINENFQNTNITNEEKRILYHDINHHLYTIQYLISNKKIWKVEEYINNLSDKIKKVEEQKICENYILNGICLIKQKKCMEKNIRYEFDIIASENLKIDDYDISTLFFNILENAIESNLKISDKKKRFIKLSVREYGNSLVIKMYNASTIENKINIMKTSKVDIQNHGFGTKSIKNTVNKYSGNVKFENKDYIFTTIIYIPYE